MLLLSLFGCLVQCLLAFCVCVCVGRGGGGCSVNASTRNGIFSFKLSAEAGSSHVGSFFTSEEQKKVVPYHVGSFFTSEEQKKVVPYHVGSFFTSEEQKKVVPYHVGSFFTSEEQKKVVPYHVGSFFTSEEQKKVVPYHADFLQLMHISFVTSPIQTAGTKWAPLMCRVSATFNRRFLNSRTRKTRIVNFRARARVCVCGVGGGGGELRVCGDVAAVGGRERGGCRRCPLTLTSAGSARQKARLGSSSRPEACRPTLFTTMPAATYTNSSPKNLHVNTAPTSSVRWATF